MQCRNITKIFKTKGNETKALDNVSFTLPTEGLVFIVGKSGSGKSTLLNVLGGLDKVTSGDIIIDDKHLSNIKEEELEKYRSSSVGFIFQDFCLIDNLTVFENVKLSLSVIGKNDETLINNTLDRLEILDQKNKYPYQLSAGQKQRVAIARAIVKDSDIILCDEPTGNLDNATGKQILDVLKEISKDKLVVIVSHNMDDAYFYADRIIELSDGHVKSDISRIKNSSLSDNTLVISNFSYLSKEEIDDINKKIKSGVYDKVVPLKYLFEDTNDDNIKEKVKECKKEKFHLKAALKLSFRLFKRRIPFTIISSLITALIVGLLYLSQSFISFDEKEAIKQSLVNNDLSSLVLKKGYFDEINADTIKDNTLVEYMDSDETLLSTSGYKGNVYKLYNYSLPVSLNYWVLSTEKSVDNSANLEHFFLKECYGVLVCNESYVKNIFFDDHDIDYVLTHSEYKDGGIYITDYVADSIMYHNPNVYSDYGSILGTYNPLGGDTSAYINGIINTNYKNVYKDVINDIISLENNYSKDKQRELYSSKEYASLIEDITTHLGICYSFNFNFMEDSKDISVRTYARIDYTTLSIPILNKNYYLANGWVYKNNSLPNMTLSVSLNTINELMETNYSLSEINNVFSLVGDYGFELSKHPAYNPNNISRYSSHINIVVHEAGESFYASTDLYNALRGADMIAYAIYLDDNTTASSALNALKDVPFIPMSLYASASLEVAEIVDVFDNIFALLATVISLIAMTSLLIFSFDLIKRNKYNIGVMKAMGVKTKDILKIFVPQILLLGIASVILFVICSFILLYVGNTILIASFLAYHSNPVLYELTILNIVPSFLFMDIALILTISLIAVIVPIIYLHFIKPIEIIRK